MSTDTATLPDGLVVVVKRECETCQTVVPVLGQLAATADVCNGIHDTTVQK